MFWKKQEKVMCLLCSGDRVFLQTFSPGFTVKYLTIERFEMIYEGRVIACAINELNSVGNNIKIQLNFSNFVLCSAYSMIRTH